MRVPGAKLCTAALLLCATLSAAAPAKKKGSGNINIIDVIIKLGSFRDLRTVMENAVTGVVSPKACSICAAATGMLFDYLDSGRSSNGLVKLIQGACAFLKIANPDACASVIDMYKDEFLYIMKNRKAPAAETCSVLLGSACGPLSSPVHNWTVQINSRVTPKPRTNVDTRSAKLQLKAEGSAEAAGSPVKVLHISDTHYDPEYEEGSNGACADPICCRAHNGAPASAAARAGKWGHRGKCDIPLRTLESALQHAAEKNQIELVLWTGDLPPHDPWKAKREDMLENLRVTSALIRKYFPNATVVPSIGNHEAVPVNRGAFYSVEVAKGFKVISLNTNLCYLYNWWLLYNSTDPSGQLQWLADELQQSEDSGEKVYIIGHVAPVKVECIPVWADNFRRIVDRYESTIVAQFYGHTHLDHMYLFYRGDGADKDGRRPTNVAYLAPSVTTFTNSNPAYRVFTVDGGRQSKNASWTLLDHETYVMDLIESNKGEKPLWNLVYTAKQHYGLQSLSPSQWHRLAEAFKTNETLFQDYHRFMHKLVVPHECGKECKAREICTLQAATTTGIRDCMIDMGINVV